MGGEGKAGGIKGNAMPPGGRGDEKAPAGGNNQGKVGGRGRGQLSYVRSEHQENSQVKMPSTCGT